MEWLFTLAGTGQEDTEKKINGLIKDIQRSTFEGIGKPEPLKGNLSGMWSRRIDDTNRIVYYEKDDIIYIVSCKGHYENWKATASPAATSYAGLRKGYAHQDKGKISRFFNNSHVCFKCPIVSSQQTHQYFFDIHTE